MKQGLSAPTAWYGYLEDSVFHLAGKGNEEYVNVVTISTGIVQSQPAWNQSLENTVFLTVRNEYPECEDIVTENVQIEIGDTVENWNEYNIIYGY